MSLNFPEGDAGFSLVRKIKMEGKHCSKQLWLKNQTPFENALLCCRLKTFSSLAELYRLSMIKIKSGAIWKC